MMMMRKKQGVVEYSNTNNDYMSGEYERKWLWYESNTFMFMVSQTNLSSIFILSFNLNLFNSTIYLIKS